MTRFCPEGWLINEIENRRAYSSPKKLAEACADSTVLEGIAEVCDAEHNLWVNLGCMRGVIPREEGAIGISGGETRDIALLSRVGKPVCFTVTEIKEDRFGKLYALLSRRNAQEKCINSYIKKLRAGDVVSARVTHLESFGAFCDIGCGVIALLPINSISISRISHPRDRFFTGEDIKAVVKSISDDGKITLTHKELLGTWEENAAAYRQGETVSGIVRSVEPYGVFIELTPNLAGLAEPKNNIFIGQTASVYVKSIIPDKMKVKLIIIDSFDTSYTQNKKYFFEGEHMDLWQYSPKESYKRIITDFLEKN